MNTNYTEKMEIAIQSMNANEYNEEAIWGFFNNNENFRSFGDGLTYIVRKKYQGDDIETYVKQCYKKHEVPFNRNTIDNWFKGNRPKKGQKNRENMYAFAFALELTEAETEELFVKVYYERPFNMRNLNEVIYWYCLKHNLSYSTAQNMICKIKEDMETEEESDIFCTEVMKNSMGAFEDKEELIGFIKENAKNFDVNLTSAKKILELLIEKTKISDEEKEQLKNGAVPNVKDENWTYCARAYNGLEHSMKEERRDLSSVSFMLEMMLSINASARNEKNACFGFKNVELIKEVKQSFPSKQILSKKDKINSEEIRKSIILLLFYGQWFEKDQMHSIDSEDVICYVNQILDAACLQPLYVGNPYDCFFMMCNAMEASLNCFQLAMLEAIGV